MDEAVTDGAYYNKKVVSGGRVAGPIKSLINARDL